MVVTVNFSKKSFCKMFEKDNLIGAGQTEGEKLKTGGFAMSLREGCFRRARQRVILTRGKRRVIIACPHANGSIREREWHRRERGASLESSPCIGERFMMFFPEDFLRSGAVSEDGEGVGGLRRNEEV